MTFLGLFLVLILIAFALWANNSYAPDPLKLIVNVLLIVLLVVWVVVTAFPGLATMPILRR